MQILFCVICVLCPSFSFPLFAQEQATVTGTVEDENGQPVPSAEVILHLPGQDVRTFTDALGKFRFDNTPTGPASMDFIKADYFRLSNFQVSITAPVTDVSIALNHEFEAHSDVQVVATPYDIEPQQTAHEEDLVAHEIREDPTPNTHDLRTALPAIPGVTQDNDGTLHVSGARSEDTLYVLDGFEINNPATGILDARVAVDAIRNIAVETGRYGAQYPNASGGVLSLETNSGDDHWRFGTTNFLPSVGLQQGVHLGNWFPRANFSGPIEKGRAWFSDGATLQHDYALITQLPRGSNVSEEWAGDNLLRLQYNVTPAQSLHANFLFNGDSANNTGLNAFMPASTTTNLSSHRFVFSSSDQILIPRGLLEFGAAADSGVLSRTPQGTATYVLTPTGPEGNYFESVSQNSRRFQERVDLTLANRHWHGAHDIQAGLNFGQTRMDQTAIRHELEVEQSDSTVVRQTSFTGNPSLAVSISQLGGYVQDSWTLSKAFILQPSLRVDRNTFIGGALPQPRMVLNWSPKSDVMKFSAGWGTYYQAIYPTLIAEAHDQQRIDVILNSPNAPANTILTTFLLPPSLKQPYYDTWSAEWQERWGSKTSSSIHAMRRRQHDGLVYEDASADPAFNNLELNNSRRDRYESVDFGVRRSFSDNAYATLDYTRSRALSNKVFDFAQDNLVLSAQAGGPLTWDAPNRVVSHGAVQTNFWKLLLSYFAEYHTGFPFSAVNSSYQAVGGANGFRYPAYFNLNVGVEKRIPFYGYQWAVRISAVNATGHNNYNAVINNVDAANFLTFSGGQGRAYTARIRLVGRK